MQARRSMAASAKPWSIPTHHSNHKLYGLTAHYESPPLVSFRKQRDRSRQPLRAVYTFEAGAVRSRPREQCLAARRRRQG